jgi:sugar lactone lactonase YvrE
MQLKLVAEDLWFPEGPIAMSDGSIVLVEIRRGTLTRVTPDGRRATVAELGGGPNGAAIGPDGAVYVCNNGGAWLWREGEEAHLPGDPPPAYHGGSIQRIDLQTGGATTLYDSCDGRPLNSPNDLTAPGMMADAESPAGGRVLCTLPGLQWLDSLAVEADGRICVATLWNGGISVFEPSGRYEHIPFPDPVTTNICFGGADMRDAWVTCSSTGRLYRCRWPRPGLRLAFNA